MFYWNPSLYMDEQVKKNPKKYRRCVEKRTLIRHCYCITMPSNRENCMEIYCSSEFRFSYYKKRKIEVIAVAADEEGIRQLLCRIVCDVLEKYGEVTAETIRKFFG